MYLYKNSNNNNRNHSNHKDYPSNLLLSLRSPFPADRDIWIGMILKLCLRCWPALRAQSQPLVYFWPQLSLLLCP